jgi:hypothetical protein
VTDVGGVATFAGLADSRAETLALVFTSGTLTPAISSSLTVSPAATTTSVTGSGTPSVFGQSVTFTAIVAVNAPGAGTPTGTVTFMDGSSVLGTGTLGTAGTATFTTSALAVATHSITAVYVGDGNFTHSTSPALSQVVNKDDTTAVVVASVNPSLLNQAISFTVTVASAAPGSGTPTGTVQFQVDGKNFGAAVALSGGTATSESISSLAVATHTVTASYSGSASFAATTSPALSQVVNKDNTTTSLAPSVNPSVFGQTVSFTATVAAVAPGTGTPAGSVTFYDGSTALVKVSLSGGEAICTTASLPTGPESITAVYNGSATLATSTSPVLSETVNQDGSTAVVTSSANPSVFGQSVTFTAIVTASAPGSGTPTGSVTFLDGTASLGTVTLSGGKATLKTSGLTVSTHAITVHYNGGTNFLASTSPLLSLVVNQDATATALKSSVNPSVYGQSVTFTATVSAAAPGSGKPTGSVTFMDDGNAIGMGTLSASGVATFKTSALATATQSITAVYGGDANFTTSTSPSLTQTVDQDATAVKLTSSKNPSVYGQSVTFTATVRASSPGSGTPTGSVTFYDGATALATMNLSDATATYTTSSLSVGAHAITAVYSGDGNFETSTSAAVNQGVNQDKTATALSSSANTAAHGQTVTFTATVTADAPGSGTPTGTVTFKDGSTVLATMPVGGGTASYSISTLSLGTHSITAVYSGDSNFTARTSSTLKETIIQQSTALISPQSSSLGPAALAPTALPAASAAAATTRDAAARPPAASSPDLVAAALASLGDEDLIRDVAAHRLSAKRARRVFIRL